MKEGNLGESMADQLVNQLIQPDLQPLYKVCYQEEKKIFMTINRKN